MDNETFCFTVKNIPENLMEKIRAAAAIEQKTINNFIIALIDQKLESLNLEELKIL